jgi:hypothetical protein
MKVNLKKLGAIVAGATVLASSAAFAGLMFGSTTLVDDNGAPVAKVVVGSTAHPSDGVAAALIAGKMVSEAYKSSALTAQVSGTATCAAGNTSGGTGTCAISNEKARLEITVPGSIAAGTWSGNNLIGDWIDRTLLDRRYANASSTDSAYPRGGADTSDNANPFTDGTGSGDIGVSQALMYRISGNQLSTFADRTLTDADSGKTYVEKQDMWINGDNKYNKDKKAVVGDLKFLAYTLKFDGPAGKQIGIPVCTKGVDSDYTACKQTPVPSGTSVDDATETHKLKVTFLGEDWIISFMDAPTLSAATNLTSETTLVHGGTVKLAKESVSGILNQGESLPVDDLKFQLDDLEAHGDSTSAILSILDANGNVLKKDKVDPASTKEYTIGGKKYRFHVYKVAPGYTFGAKWADVAIFSKELELKDGQKLDQSVGTNEGYRVALGWKNLDAGSATAAQQTPDTLRTIVVYTDQIEMVSSSSDTVLAVGDYVPLVQDPAVWRLSYKGLDLESNQKVKLKFDLRTDDKTISSGYGPLNGSLDRPNCTIFAPYILVSSSDTGSVFSIERDDSSGDLSDSQFLVALKSTTDSAHAAVCGVDAASSTNLSTGSVFMKESASSSYYGYTNYTAGGLEVKYQAIGDGDTQFAPPRGGAILVEWASSTNATGDGHLGDLFASAGYSITTAGNGWQAVTDTTTTKPQVWFATAEKAGTGTSSSFVDYFAFAITGIGTSSSSDATMSFISSDVLGKSLTSDADKVLYGHATANIVAQLENASYGTIGPVESGVALQETSYVSERGSKFDSQSSSSVTFTMAHKLAYAQWFLAPSAANATSSSKSIVTLGEGESTTISGVTVKVLEITEDVGACSASGGSSACTPNMAGVSAVIMPNNAATVNVAMPYAYSNYGNLVILDQDAVGVSTLVSVGGDAVNTVTAGLLQSSAVDWSVESKVVREVVQGSKIVVAGKTKEDTLSAAQDFVSQLKKV